MTNKEAINILSSLPLQASSDSELVDIQTAVKMAIKALEFQSNIKEAYYSLSGFELKNYIREEVKNDT